MWVEHLARSAGPAAAYPFPYDKNELDFQEFVGGVRSGRLEALQGV